MVHEIDVHGPQLLGELEGLFLTERRGLEPLTILPVTPLGRDLADIDLRVEIGGKGLAMVTRVAVDDIDGLDLIQVLFADVGAEDAGHPGIKAAAQQGHEPGLAKAFMIGPLVAVLEVSRVRRLVVGGVEIMDTGGQTGLHDGEILVGQGQVHDQVRLERADQRAQFGDLVGVHLSCLNRSTQFGGNLLALGNRPAGQHDLAKDLRQGRTFMGHHAADSTGADDHYSAHDLLLFLFNAKLLSAFKIGVTAKPFLDKPEDFLSLFRLNPAGPDRLFGILAEAGQQGPGVMLHIGEDIGYGVPFDLA